MKKYLVLIKQKKDIVIILLGVAAFAFILVTTLNLTLAFLTLVIFINLAIFQKSFHLGWIFSLVVIIGFPTIYITDSLITLEEVMIFVLALIGLASFNAEGRKIKIFPLFYYWLGLIILGGVIYILGNSTLNISKSINDITLYQLIIVFTVYPIITVAFQYFFQTIRRLERFFLVLVLIGLGQAIFSLLAVIFGWEFANGVGVTSEIFSNAFSNNIVNHSIGQATGFLGDNLFLQLGDNLLAMLLLITIPVTLGIWFVQKDGLSTLSFRQLTQEANEFNKIVDSILQKNNQINKAVIDLKTPKKIRSLKQNGLLFILLIQIIALIFTFSYLSLIVLGIGVFLIGILMREDKLILVVLSLLFIFVVILPGFEPALLVQTKEYVLDFLISLKNVRSIDLLVPSNITQSSNNYNSYFIILNKFGLLGIILFILGLGQYFREIRQAYLKSDGLERIWLLVILAIFIEFTLLGLFNNLFFVGPAALLFWLLYGALQNLKSKQVEFRLTETKIK